MLSAFAIFRCAISVNFDQFRQRHYCIIRECLIVDYSRKWLCEVEKRALRSAQWQSKNHFSGQGLLATGIEPEFRHNRIDSPH